MTKKRQNSPQSDDTDADPVVSPPPAFPIDKAIADAHAPDPGNDQKSAILERCATHARSQPPEPPPPSRLADIDQGSSNTETEQPSNEQQQGAAAGAETAEGAATAAGAAAATGSEASNRAAASAIGARPPATSDGDARTCEVPEDLGDQLARLPQWQARYVLSLMELGGVQALACRKCGVSRQSVEKYQNLSPEFATACANAVAHSTDLVEAALFRGATVGDTQPVYQGGLLVGYKRVRSSRDAEVLLRLRGRLEGGALGSGSDGRSGGRPAPHDPEATAAIVAATLAALFAARGAQPRQLPAA